MDYYKKLQKSLGKKIRQIRESLGLTQENIAEKANLHPIHIGRCERGEVNITVATIERIANALGISSADILKTLKDKDENVDIDKKLIEEINLLLDRHKPKDLETIKRLIIALGQQNSSNEKE